MGNVRRRQLMPTSHELIEYPGKIRIDVDVTEDNGYKWELGYFGSNMINSISMDGVYVAMQNPGVAAYVNIPKGKHVIYCNPTTRYDSYMLNLPKATYIRFPYNIASRWTGNTDVKVTGKIDVFDVLDENIPTPFYKVVWKNSYSLYITEMNVPKGTKQKYMDAGFSSSIIKEKKFYYKIS